jgi:hypothetical protein
MNLSNTGNNLPSKTDPKLCSVLDRIDKKYQVYQHYREIHPVVDHFLHTFIVLQEWRQNRNDSIIPLPHSADALLDLANNVDEFIESVKQ